MAFEKEWQQKMGETLLMREEPKVVNPLVPKEHVKIRGYNRRCAVWHIIRDGKKTRKSEFDIYSVTTPEKDIIHLAVVMKKTIVKLAVDRNKIKRRMREAVRNHLGFLGARLVVVVRKNGNSMESVNSIKEEMKRGERASVR
jgi:ribonuclease P protein component